MSVQSALLFIRAVHEQEHITRRVEALGPHATLAHIVAIGRDSGFDFSEDELRQAHAHDWSLRWVRLDDAN